MCSSRSCVAHTEEAPPPASGLSEEAGESVGARMFWRRSQQSGEPTVIQSVVGCPEDRLRAVCRFQSRRRAGTGDFSCRRGWGDEGSLYAKALLAVARDHFDFFTAESEIQPPPEAVVAEDASHIDQRLAMLEASMKSIQEGMKRLLPPAQPKTLFTGRPKAPPGLPANLDPVVARQALQAGVSREALVEMASMFPAAAPAAPPGLSRPAPRKDAIDSEEEEEAEADDAGFQNTVEKAVIQMPKLLTSLHQEKKVRKDRLLENILDRADLVQQTREILVLGWVGALLRG